MQKETKDDRDNNIKYYLSVENTSFISLLIGSKKYKELFYSIEAFLSLVITIIMVGSIYFVIQILEFDYVINNLRSILLSMFGALISMLGFIIGGLAILTGTISNKVLNKVDRDKGIKSLLSILFSFYFTGFIIGVTIFLSLLATILSYVSCYEYPFIVIIFAFVIGYLFSFSIIYSIALLGSCIRILLVNYKYSLEK